jgi:hypothetical protein
MSLLAGIFMIVACASFSSNVETVQKLAFMVVSTHYEGKSSAGVTGKVSKCDYIGLQAFCSAMCGTNVIPNPAGTGTVDVPKTNPLYSCKTAGGTDASGAAVDSNVVYKTVYDLAQCGNDAIPKNAATTITCNELSTCITGGNVTMAFAVIGCIGALFAMVIFAWRMNGDAVCPKLISIIFSTGTFISCTTAFGAFQPCAKLAYDNAQVTAATTALSLGASNVVVGVAPGVGGAMAVTSFVFFIYVMLMSIFVPAAAPAAADAGLDAAAPAPKV